MFWPLRPEGAERPGAAASPQGWPPPHKIPPTRIRKLFASNLVLDEKAQRPMRFTGEVPWRGMVGLEGAVGTSKGKGGECDFLLGGGLRGILNWDFSGFLCR
jgi:hypothetical protein